MKIITEQELKEYLDLHKVNCDNKTANYVDDRFDAVLNAVNHLVEVKIFDYVTTVSGCSKK